MTSHFLNKIPDHQVHKEKLIHLINKIPPNRYNNISHTDWNLPQDIRKEWQHYFFKKIFLPWSKIISDQTNQTVALHNLWFQCYEKGDYHDWHVHNDTHFTNVYYLKLPNPNVKTSIIALGKEINFDICEGDVLTFPAFWKHCSPINTYEDSKIIISFNIDLNV